MQKFGLFMVAFCGVVFCATVSFAQLSANPWVDANTKEQVDEVYDKYQRRGYHATDVKYVGDSKVIIEKAKEHIEELNTQEKPSFFDKFADDEKEPEQAQTEVVVEDISAPSFDLSAKINQVKNSLKLPKLNTNNLIRKFERSIGVDFKAMARKLK